MIGVSSLESVLTFREEVCGQLDLGEVPRAQFRFEAVEADPLAEGHLTARVLVVLVLPQQPLIWTLLIAAAGATSSVESVLVPRRRRY